MKARFHFYSSILLLLISAAVGTSSSATAGAILDTSDGLLQDLDRGLTWVADGHLALAEGQVDSLLMPRVQALEILARMNAGEIDNFGFSDWRIPTVRELETVRDLIDLEGAHLPSVVPADVVFLWPVRGASTLPGFSNVSIFAINSVRLKNDADVLSGDVVVNDASAGPTLVDGYEVGLEPKSSTAAGSSVKADSLRVKNNATVGGNAVYNDLNNQGTIQGTPTSPLSLPVFSLLPKFFAQAPAPGSPAVAVGNGGFAVLPEGDHGAVTIAKNGTLVLSGGTYNLESITADKGVSLLFRAPARVRVTGRLLTDKDATIGPEAGSGISADDIVFYIAGINGSDGALDSTPRAAEWGKSSVVDANFYAPNGLINVGHSSTFTGALLARDVLAENKSSLSLESFFSNIAPNAEDDSATVDEGGTVSQLDSGATSLLDNDSDPNPTDVLAVTTTPVSGPDNGDLTLNSDGTFSYTHDGGETTSDIFVYEVCDDGIPVECSTATVTITVNPINDPPVAEDDAATVDEAGTVSQLDSGATSLLDNDTDPDGPNLQVTTIPVSGPDNGDLTLNNDGTFSYTHDGSETTEDSFVYEVCDGGTPDECDSATVAITVNPINDPPTAMDDSATLTEGATVAILDSGANTVLANDSDPDSSTLTVTSVAGSGPVHGSLTLNGDGTFSYTHNGSETTSDAFVYQVCDDGTPVECATATVAITVVLVNDPPTAVDDSTTVRQGEAVNVLNSGAASVLANDSDPDSTVLTVTTTPVSGPTHGTLTLNADGTFVYSNDGNENVADSFVYQVCDNGTPMACSTATVAITILPNGTINVTKFGLGSGTVTSSPSGINCGAVCSAEFPGGEIVTLTATASGTSVFSGFSGDPDCADGVVTSAGVKTCLARFDASSVPAVLTVTTAGSGSGSVRSSPAGIDCPATSCSAGFPIPTRVNLSATADPGSTFVGWSGAADCVDGSISLTEDTTCTANFEVQPATLTVTKIGGGSGTVTSSPAGIDCGSTCSATFPGVPSVTLTAAPSGTSVFAGFSGHPDCADGVITPDSDKVCFARFDEPAAGATVTITTAGGGTGRVVSSPSGIDCPGTCSATFPVPSQVNLTPIADAGSVFVRWAGDADCSDGNLRLSESASCTAIFDLEVVTTDRTLNVVFQGGGTGTVAISPPGVACSSNCSATVTDGTTVTLSVRPRTGTFAGWAGDCAGTAFVTTVLMDADKTCIATINP